MSEEADRPNLPRSDTPMRPGYAHTSNHSTGHRCCGTMVQREHGPGAVPVFSTERNCGSSAIRSVGLAPGARGCEIRESWGQSGEGPRKRCSRLARERFTFDATPRCLGKASLRHPSAANAAEGCRRKGAPGGRGSTNRETPTGKPWASFACDPSQTRRSAIRASNCFHDMPPSPPRRWST